MTFTLMMKFSFTLLPIALSFHLAQNATHVFYEWSKLRPLASDPLGWGTDFFGTARAPLLRAVVAREHLVPPGRAHHHRPDLLVVAQRAAFRLYKDKKASFRVHLVMMVGMIVMSMLSLWLLAQPMFMRTAEV